MIDHAGAVVLPEVIVVAMAHSFDKPSFVVRREFQGSCAGTKWETPHIVTHVIAHVEQGGSGRRVRSRACRCGSSVRSSSRVSHRHYPIEEAQLEGAVVSDAVASEVGHGIYLGRG